MYRQTLLCWIHEKIERAVLSSWAGKSWEETLIIGVLSQESLRKKNAQKKERKLNQNWLGKLSSFLFNFLLVSLCLDKRIRRNMTNGGFQKLIQLRCEKHLCVFSKTVWVLKANILNKKKNPTDTKSNHHCFFREGSDLYLSKHEN